MLLIAKNIHYISPTSPRLKIDVDVDNNKIATSV